MIHVYCKFDSRLDYHEYLEMILNISCLSGRKCEKLMRVINRHVETVSDH